MQVDVIETLEDLERLRGCWDRVQEADPDAGYFLSWRWLSVVFRDRPGRWRVLAVRPDGGTADHVAFLPLRLDLRWSASRAQFATRVDAGGRLSWAQYTGFLCLPEVEDDAVPALAAALRDLPWSHAHLRNWLVSDRRRELFLSAFPPEEHEVTVADRVREEGRTDNHVCPYVPLPESYEDYLATRVSANTRQKIRRFTRKVEQSPDLRLELADPAAFEEHLDQLLELWLRRWTPVRGRDTAEHVARRYREVLRQSLECDAVLMPGLWSGDRLLGGLVHVVDHRSGVVHFIVAGRDEAASDPGIGLVLHAWSIRWAVEHGMGVYDLCHGDEPYKYSLGATDKRIAHLSIRRRSGFAGGRLDPLTVPDALGSLLDLVTDGRVDDAVSACRQLATLCRAADDPGPDVADPA